MQHTLITRIGLNRNETFEGLGEILYFSFFAILLDALCPVRSGFNLAFFPYESNTIFYVTATPEDFVPVLLLCSLLGNLTSEIWMTRLSRLP